MEAAPEVWLHHSKEHSEAFKFRKPIPFLHRGGGESANSNFYGVRTFRLQLPSITLGCVKLYRCSADAKCWISLCLY